MCVRQIDCPDTSRLHSLPPSLKNDRSCIEPLSFGIVMRKYKGHKQIGETSVYTSMGNRPKYAVHLDHNETEKHTDMHCAVIPPVVSHKLPSIFNVPCWEGRIETMGRCDSHRL